ncbi:TPA: carbohydrate binding domain-containing protein [Klebsiella quasipneumoniae subsp. similipneumoniae]|nr:carbohydrate binding domain-containing protein [Klebsiella quasipneumoniae subsp. similipneumoniae]
MATITGAKGGGGNAHTPVEQPDSAQSLARCRMLLALGEGEFAGGLDATRIYLDGTPLGNSDGTMNFEDVSWEFRPGTQTQDHIAGFPAVENEITVGVSLTAASPWVRAVTNTQLDAVLVRVGIPSLEKQEDNGDVNGASVSYHIDVSTDGGAYETLLSKTVTEKLSTLYELTHRINLPKANTGWQIRVVRDTPDSTSQRLLDKTQIQAITEVIDARLRYPHTALLYVSFNAKSFNSIPKISCLPRGRIIRIPSNYDAESRTYTGTWDGTFKWGWSNNPAWIWFDILTEPRFGLGRRVTADMLDKWELYRIAQRCDELVPDGKGGTGKEPRFVFDVYIQAQADAWQVIKDVAAGFSGMTFWGNNMFNVVSDMPADESKLQILTRASVVGKPSYSSGSEKNRYSSALINFSDPDNHYQDRTTAVMFPDLVKQFKFKQTQLTAIGCTRESEAQRRGGWAVYSNYLDRIITVQTGLDGYAFVPGTVFAFADERLSGRVYGGRVTDYDASILAVTVDRGTSAAEGDTLMIRTLGGTVESRTIQAVNGTQLIVTEAFTAPPAPDAVFVIDAGQLRLQYFRVTKLTYNDEDNTFTITGAEYNSSKYDAVDNNARLDTPPISLIPTGIVSPPRNVMITSYDAVQQGQRSATLVASWDAPLDKTGKAQADIVGYQAQWKRDDNEWINLPETGLRNVEVAGIFTGGYLVRVRAINSAGTSSLWATSELTSLSGRAGDVPQPLGLAATDDIVSGINITWSFPGDSGDTLSTELQYSATADGANPALLAAVPYPQHIYQQAGLALGQKFWYRARLVDRLGNASPWTGWIGGMASDNLDDYYQQLDNAIKGSDTYGELTGGLKDVSDSAQAANDAAQAAQAAADDAANTIQQQQQQIENQASDIQQNANDIITAANAGAANAGAIAQEILDRQDGDLATATKAANDVADAIAKAETDNAEVAAQAAANLLAAKNEVEAEISTTNITMQDGFDSLAQQMASISAGTGEQFDSLKIWYFDNDSEGWSSDDGGTELLPTTDDGWILPADSISTMRSPSGAGTLIDGSAYKYIRLRIKKVGDPSWDGRLYWIGADETGWTQGRSLALTSSEFDPSTGISTIAIPDIPWQSSGTIRRLRFDFSPDGSADADNYYAVDWLAVGRPTPGASQAQIQDLKTAMTAADSAEASERNTLAVQMRGNSTSTDPALLTTGLIYNERQVRITAEKAISSTVTALQTDYNANKASVSNELSTLTDANNANAKSITELQSDLGDIDSDVTALTKTVATKADASAVTALTTRVTNVEGEVSTNSNAITQLGNELDTTTDTLNGKINTKADATALTALTTRVAATETTNTTQAQQISTLGSTLVFGSELYNGNVTQNADGWANSGSGSSFTWDSSQAIRATTGSVRVANVTPIAVEPGEKVYLSLQIKATEDFTGGSSDTVGFISNLDNPTAWIPGMSTLGWLSNITPGSTDYVTLEYSYTVPADFAGKFIYFRIAAGATNPVTSARVYFTKVLVTTGMDIASKASAEALQSLATTVDQNGDDISSHGAAITELQNDLTTTQADVKTRATAASVNALTNTVTQQGKTITSNSAAITNLQGDLSDLSDDVDTKASAAALTALTQRVTNAEGVNDSQATSITNLNATASAVRAASGNLIPNGTFEPVYANNMGYTVVSSTADGVPSGCPFAYVAKLASRDHMPSFNGFPVRAGDVYEMSVLVACGTGSAVFNQYVVAAASPTGSFAAASSGGQVTAANGATWVRSVFRHTITAAEAAKGYMRPMLQISQSSPFGTIWYATDWSCRNITAAAQAQNTADANTSAISSLDTRVTTAEKNITATSSSLTTLAGRVTTAENNIKTKADASALTALTTRVTNAEGVNTTQGNAITQLNNSVDAFQNDVDSSGAIVGNMLANPSFERGFDAWTNSGFATYTAQGPHSGKLILTATGSSAGTVCTISQAVNLKAGRSYRFGVYARRTGDAVVADQSNTKISVRSSDSATLIANANMSGSTVPTGSTWADNYVVYKPASDITVLINFRASLSAGTYYFDDAYVVDTTDADQVAANATAITGLTSTVTQNGKDISSQGSQITSLNNSLATTNKTLGTKADQSDLTALTTKVNTKADASALSSLQSTVSSLSGTVTSQGTQITSLNNTLSTTTAAVTDLTNDASSAAAIPGNMLVNGGFEFDGNGWTVVSGIAPVYRDASAPHSGVRIIEAQTGEMQLSQIVSVKAGKTYQFGAFARRNGGTATDNQAYNKVRIGGTDGNIITAANIVTENLATSSAWSEISGTFTPTADREIDFGIWTSVKGGVLYIDDAYLIDVTALTTATANASAIATLNNTVTQQGKDITSASSSITSLANTVNTKASQSDLNALKTTVNTKADASALSALQSTVTTQGNTITSQGSSITQLGNSLISGNEIYNGDLNVSADGWQDSGSGSGFTFYEQGGRGCIQTTGNSIRVANQTPIAVEPGMTVTVAFSLRTTDGGTLTSDTMGLTAEVDFSSSVWTVPQVGWGAGVTTSWKRYTYDFVVPASFTGNQLYLRFACAGMTTSGKIQLTNVMVTKSTGIISKADTSALNALTTRVTTAEGKITANTTSVNKISARMDDAEAAIDNVNETVASNGLAMTNGFNQMRSMIGDNSASITNVTQTVADLDKATASSISTLTTSVNNASASVQTVSQALADTNGKLSAQYGVKVTTDSNGNNPRVAGIQLGIDATGSSQFLVQADTFAVYTAAGGVSPFAVSGNAAYLQSALIQDASISFGKITDSLQSSNYVANSTGWRLPKSGDFQINGNVPGEGRVQIDSTGLAVYDENGVLRCKIGRI